MTTEDATKAWRRRRGRVLSALFTTMCFTCALVCVLMLAVLLFYIVREGWNTLSWGLLTHFTSRFPEKAGIRAALAGSLWLIAFTTLFALPTGVGAAVYLEEYAPKTRWTKLIQLNISNLAGVPSIVYGLLGMAVFVQFLAFGQSVLAGALTLALVVLPIIILATQEALRAVPDSIRHASYALGATKWQTVRYQVLPAATPGIMTGVILALSRAIGEAAPLIAVGAVAVVPFTPGSIMDKFSAMPILIYSWMDRSVEGFRQVAAAAIIVLLAVLIFMNAIAVFVRYRYAKQIRW